MSKPTWWTCGCGRKNVSRGPGRPQCGNCLKFAKFEKPAPKSQGKLSFTQDLLSELAVHEAKAAEKEDR